MWKAIEWSVRMSLVWQPVLDCSISGGVAGDTGQSKLLPSTRSSVASSDQANFRLKPQSEYCGEGSLRRSTDIITRVRRAGKLA